MKTILKLILVLTISSQFTIAQTEVKLRINHLLGEVPFSFNEIVIDSYNNEFIVDRLEYYISGISLVHDGGNITDTNTLFLVDASENEDLFLGNYDLSNIEAIKFSIGVEEAKNHEDPTAYPTDHPLYPQSPSMHWGWAGGYRFIAYEGICNGNVNYQFHCLGDKNYFQQEIVIEQTTEENNALIIELDADYIQGVKDIKLSLGPISHEEGGEALTCITNFANEVFKATKIEAATSIAELTDNIAKIYPIPSNSNFVNIDLDTNENYELKVFDVLGKLVSSQTLNKRNNQVFFKQSGVYFFHLQNEKGDIYSQKISIL